MKRFVAVVIVAFAGILALSAQDNDWTLEHTVVAGVGVPVFPNGAFAVETTSTTSTTTYMDGQKDKTHGFEAAVQWRGVFRNGLALFAENSTGGIYEPNHYETLWFNECLSVGAGYAFSAGEKIRIIPSAGIGIQFLSWSVTDYVTTWGSTTDTFTINDNAIMFVVPVVFDLYVEYATTRQVRFFASVNGKFSLFGWGHKNGNARAALQTNPSVTTYSWTSVDEFSKVLANSISPRFGVSFTF